MLTAAQELAECFRNVYKSDWNVNPSGEWTREGMESYLARREAQIATNLDEGRRWDYCIGVDDYDYDELCEMDARESMAADADSLSFTDWMAQRAEAMGVET